jgi:hypothetical protein
MSAPTTPPPVVLVTFYSCCGTTESQALHAAVGAVQARGLIRMRRLPDADPARTRDLHPECRETLARMHREYVAPAEADVLAADGLIVGTRAGATPASPEWEGFFDLLTRLAREGRLAGKVAAVLDAGDADTTQAFAAALVALGLTAPVPAAGPGPDGAVALGRQVADTARVLRETAG